LYNKWCSTYTWTTTWDDKCYLWTTFKLWECKL
jgi:hypothetical protein